MSGRILIGVAWIKARTIDPAAIPAVLDRRLDAKAVERNNFVGYKYRPQSVQHITINGQAALTAIADYSSGGKQIVEYLTWIDGPQCRIRFAARVLNSELVDFQPRFNNIIQSAIVP